jgi:2-polyprenyl-3-methyl-5-hydroxy-6-metoxy-1,4-benzoquinol methylase
MDNFIERNFSNFYMEHDIWHSKANNEISYPENGNEICFQIEDSSFWFNHRNNCILSAIQNYTNEKILFDVGGGNGFVSKFLQNNGFEIFLVEPGLKGILNARKRGVKNLVNSVLDDNFKNESIPNIGIFDVLEHMKDDLSFLRNIYNKLNKDGMLFITVPSYQFLWSTEDSYAGHHRRYSIKKVEKLIKEAGFCIEYSTYFFSVLALPIFIFRTIPSIFNRRKKINLNIDINQHKQSFSPSLLGKIWSWEIGKISKSSKIPFGSSCLVIAKKL